MHIGYHSYILSDTTTDECKVLYTFLHTSLQGNYNTKRHKLVASVRCVVVGSNIRIELNSRPRIWPFDQGQRGLIYERYKIHSQRMN